MLVQRHHYARNGTCPRYVIFILFVFNSNLRIIGFGLIAWLRFCNIVLTKITPGMEWCQSKRYKQGPNLIIINSPLLTYSPLLLWNRWEKRFERLCFFYWLIFILYYFRFLPRTKSTWSWPICWNPSRQCQSWWV